MSLLAQIADILIAVRIAPQYLYIQRHLHNQLMEELERSSPQEAQQLINLTTLFGLPVVWVQNDAHPDVRAI